MADLGTKIPVHSHTTSGLGFQHPYFREASPGPWTGGEDGEVPMESVPELRNNRKYWVGQKVYLGFPITF